MRILYTALLVLFFMPSVATPGEIKVDEQFQESLNSFENLKTLTPIYSQKVSFSLPKGWKPAFENNTKTTYMMEYVPQNETVKNWQSMFTVQGFKGLSEKAAPADILAKLALSYLQFCGKENLVLEQVNEDKASGHDAKSIILGCAKMKQDHPSGLKKGMGEVAYFIAIKGKKDIYLLHKAKRSKAFNPKKPPITKDNVQDFIKDFLPVEIL